MKSLTKRILHRISGKIRYQKIFERIYHIALRGMNYGNGGDCKVSGELFALEYIQKKIGDETGIVLFDVGANAGRYTLELSGLFGIQHVQIHAFEPSKLAYRKLEDNVKGIKGITLNNLGLSDTDSTLQLYTDVAASGLASLYRRRLDHFNIGMDQSEQVQLTSIDNYCARHNIEKIHFLKLDAEGHEWKILQGASKMILGNKIDFIQFEFGGCDIDSRTYFQDFFYFLKKDFRIYRIVQNGLFPIDVYKETYEIFTTINYLAERRIN